MGDEAVGLEPLVVIDDYLAEDQWRAQFKSRARSPELRLMLEILVDAIRLYLGDIGKEKAKQIPEAEAWLAVDNDLFYGFVNVCESLGIEPQALRAGLKAARAEPGNHRISRAPRGQTIRSGISQSRYHNRKAERTASIGCF